MQSFKGSFWLVFLLSLQVAFAAKKKQAPSKKADTKKVDAKKSEAKKDEKSEEINIETPWVPFKGVEVNHLESFDVKDREVYSIDTIDFPNSQLQLETKWYLDELSQISNLNLNCPQRTTQCSPLEIEKLAEDFPVIVLDPGHNEMPASNRTEFKGAGRGGGKSNSKESEEEASQAIQKVQALEMNAHPQASKYLHEGKINTVQSLLARYFIENCLISKIPKWARPPVYLTRYPMEKYYGDYLAPRWKAYVQDNAGYDAPYIASEINLEYLPMSAEREKLFQKRSGNFVFRLNQRSAYINFLINGGLETPEVFQSVDYFPWGVKPTDLLPEDEAKFESFLPVETFKLPALLASFHSETANRKIEKRFDTVSVFYPRIPPERAPIKKEIMEKSVTEPNPRLQVLSSTLADAIAEEQVPYFSNILEKEFKPAPITRVNNLFLLHATRAKYSILVESFDTTGKARGHMEKLAENKMGQLVVRLVSNGLGINSQIYPLYPLALASAKGFVEGLAKNYCLAK